MLSTGCTAVARRAPAHREIEMQAAVGGWALLGRGGFELVSRRD
jgi:hypothetical protein